MKRPLAVLTLALFWLLPLPGCGRHWELSQPGYEYAKALHSLARRRRPEKLELLREQIAASQAAGSLPDREAAQLTPILEAAKKGRWSQAVDASRSLLEAQVVRR